MNENDGSKKLEVLWSPQQVAKYLGLNKSTVYKWLASGTVLDQTKIIRFSNRVRIPRSEVERIAGITVARLKGDI